MRPQKNDLNRIGWFSWPGVQISARFTGASISARLSGSRSGDRFLTLIDGEPRGDAFNTGRCTGSRRRSWTTGCWKNHVLAEGLAEGRHNVTLRKISEDLNSGWLAGWRAGGMAGG